MIKVIFIVAVMAFIAVTFYYFVKTLKVSFDLYQKSTHLELEMKEQDLQNKILMQDKNDIDLKKILAKKEKL